MSRATPAFAFAAAALLASCSEGDRAAPVAEDAGDPAANTASANPSAAATHAEASAVRWDMVSSGEGVALVFPGAGKAAVRLFCPAGSDRILVNVPAFRAIGSEERLTFGSGGAAHALVADTRGDASRGGVSGTGAVPGNLAALIGGPVSVSYGAQSSGPHPAPPADLARTFAAACREGPAPTPTASAPATGTVSACQTQDGQRLSVARLRAVGTEPFWGARIDGRCVTYSHPNDQQGTRVWTRYTASAGAGTWTGALNGRPFVLRTRAQPGCSDGMSDQRYPIAVDLTVGGEQRQGCARGE